MPELSPHPQKDGVAAILAWLHGLLSSGAGANDGAEQILRELPHRFGSIGAGLTLKPAMGAALPSLEYWEAEQRPVHLEYPWDNGALARDQIAPVIIKQDSCTWLIDFVDDQACPGAVLWVCDRAQRSWSSGE